VVLLYLIQEFIVMAIERPRGQPREKGNLAEFLAASPLRDSGIDLERVRDPARKLDLEQETGACDE
jgi:hypothetical protein